MYRDSRDIISNQVEMGCLGPSEHEDLSLCFGVWLLSYAGLGAQRTNAPSGRASDDQCSLKCFPDTGGL